MTGTAAYIISRLEQEAQTLPDRNNEIIQHLIELGYLALFKVNALRVADVTKAREDFLRDVSTSELFSPEYTDRLSLTGKEDMICSLLRRVTDIDKGITIATLPKKGETNLVSRMIHYRLDIFGLWPMDVSAVFSTLSILKLDVIGGFTNSNALDAINYLADIEGFTRYLLSVLPPEKFILTFRSARVSDVMKKKLDRRYAFKQQLIDDFGERSDFFKYLTKEVLKNNPAKVDFGFLQKETLDPFKQFVLRLIQVHQWQEGFYTGLLDSLMGEVTLASLLEAIDFYNNSENKHIKTHRIITYIHQDYFLFNSLFFLQEYMVEDVEEHQNNEKVLLEKITYELIHADTQSQSDFTTNIKQLKSDIYNETSRQPTERKGLLQRIYFGVKRLIKKAFRIARKIFSWVKNKVAKAWSFLKHLFRHYFESLKSGINAFIDGLKFMFGKHIASIKDNEQHIFSKFSLDGDSITITSNHISDIFDTHFQTIAYNIKSMKFTLAIVAGILKLISGMLNVLTWPLLLLNIIKIYNNILESYQEIKFTNN